MAKVSVTRSEKEGFLRGIADNFEVLIDRGEVSSPRSIELVMLGLGACTVATVQHYVNRKEISVTDLGAEVTAELDEATNTYSGFKISLALGEGLTEAEKKIILGIAKSCRIHKTLTSDLDVDISLREPTEKAVHSGDTAIK